MDRKENKARLELALTAAYEAEKVILELYQSPALKVSTKIDKTVVTDADKKSETIIRTLIERHFPDDSIIGEEHGSKTGKSPYSWIIDPVDGTQSLICGVPLFGTMIGVTYRSESGSLQTGSLSIASQEKPQPVVGVVNMPALKEVYYASHQDGAFWIPQGTTEPLKAQASTAKEISQSLFCTTSHAGFDRVGRRGLLDKFMNKAKKFRGWGSCHGHMLVATGRADFIVEPDLKIWDCAALYPIVTEAGGVFFDLQGRHIIDGGSGISASAHLYNEIMGILNSN